jgi:hypothetical protein
MKELADRELMDIHINTLFRLDQSGRLLSTNEVGDGSAPRFYMGRTRTGNVWRYRHDLPPDLIHELERLCQEEPVASDSASLPQWHEAIRAVLQEHAPIEEEYRGPAFVVPKDIHVPVNTVRILAENAQLLQKGFPWLLRQLDEAARAPIVAVVVEGNAVSVCFCSRIPGEATEAGLQTLEQFRNRGYATVATARWAAEVRQHNYMPLYSTSWHNLASQSVAHKLNMRMYGEDWSIQ